MTTTAAVETPHRDIYVNWPGEWRALPLWSQFAREKNVGHPHEEMLSVYRDHGVVKKDSRNDNYNKTAENRDIYQLVDKGWLIVNRMKAWQGSVGISAHRGIVSGHYICFRPRHSEDHRYLNWLLRSDVYAYEYARLSRGVRPSQIEIDNDELHSLAIHLPNLSEQRRIAAFLDAETARIDELRAKRRAYVNTLSERLDSLWSDAIESVAASTPLVAIRRFILAITDGPFGSSLTSDHYTDSGARVIRLGNIGRAKFRPDDVAFISRSHFADLRRHETRPGDLIIAGLGDEAQPLGRACVVPNGIGPAIVKADCFRLRLDHRVDHHYAAWALSAPPVSKQIALLARGSTRSRMNLSVAREVRIPVPSLDNQRRVTDMMSQARNEINRMVDLCTKQLALLAERRQALITAAVTGQFDVTTAQGADLS